MLSEGNSLTGNSENFYKIRKKNPLVLESFSDEVVGVQQPTTFLKKIPAQVFPWEYWEQLLQNNSFVSNCFCIAICNLNKYYKCLFRGAKKLNKFRFIFVENYIRH